MAIRTTETMRRRGRMKIDGGRLEELRIGRDRTQAELAQEAGVARDTVSKLESGARKSAHGPTVGKLAQALRVEPQELCASPSPTDAEGGAVWSPPCGAIWGSVTARWPGTSREGRRWANFWRRRRRRLLVFDGIGAVLDEKGAARELGLGHVLAACGSWFGGD